MSGRAYPLFIRCTTCAVVAAASLTYSALGQSDAQAPVNPALDEEAAQLARPSSPPMEIAPADALSRSIGEASPIPQPALIREGAILSKRIGVLRRLRGGGWAFLSSSSDGGRIALILMPSTRLTEMTRLVDSSPDPITFEVSGQIFAYRGRNYLLPVRFRTTSANDEPALKRAPSAEQPEDNSAFDRPGAPSSSTTSIDDLLEEVDERSGAERSSGATGNVGAELPLSADSEHGLALLREGAVVSARLGRLRPATTSGSTGWMLLSDSDASGDSGPTVPLILMPCQNLSGMERLISEHGDSLRFTVSGIVYVYEGQNHLLPTMYLVELDRSGNLTSAQ